MRFVRKDSMIEIHLWSLLVGGSGEVHHSESNEQRSGWLACGMLLDDARIYPYDSITAISTLRPVEWSHKNKNNFSRGGGERKRFPQAIQFICKSSMTWPLRGEGTVILAGWQWAKPLQRAVFIHSWAVRCYHISKRQLLLCWARSKSKGWLFDEITVAI